MTAEQSRIAENDRREQGWHAWGPYLAERQWGTVREDYSARGEVWDYFTHEQARARAYRWGEDGIGGISDWKQRLCLAFAFWNERDPFLKERLFGLTGPQGNHGEDVKELYFYTDNTPTHSFMRMLYRYPQAAFPYAELVAKNADRSRLEPEFELWNTAALEQSRFFDIALEFAKAGSDDICVRVIATNRGPESAALHILPTLWFRNTWSWGRDDRRPKLRAAGPDRIDATHPDLGDYQLVCAEARELLFTENDTNAQALFGAPNPGPFVKDGINDFIVHGSRGAVNPERMGTKASAHHRFEIPAGESVTVRLRLSRRETAPAEPFARFDEIFDIRAREASEFYREIEPASLTSEHREIFRQALAGMLWNKQFYYYIVEQWLTGDPAQPAPPPERLHGRNCDWRHLYNERVMSMPDAWEYPWYASWDTAFHAVTLALVDPHFAKGQLDLIVREWYQHPNGQVPAYEWDFGDVNPPVFAWAAWRVFKIEEKQTGRGDRAFLETVFHKLLLTFTWWVNRKDYAGKNIFQGGFLGLDNIGVFDRSARLPGGAYLQQSDGTSWMGMFCLNMMRTALELARANPVYENIASKFFEHFLGIAGAMNNVGGIGLWDDEDEFFYDVLQLADGRAIPLRVRSIVGLMPLLAVETIEPELLEAMPGFKARLEWFLENRPDLASLISRWTEPGAGERRLIALTRGHRMKCLLRRMLDAAEFLSDYGVRSVSKFHGAHPYLLRENGQEQRVDYEPAESRTGLFGGNSNWRGPVWMPINFLLIESLQKFHHYYGDDFKVECPTGSGQFCTLEEIANDLSNRLIQIWTRDAAGERPFTRASGDSLDREADAGHYLFHEYFHGETGAGLGASHQTGWTGLIAKLIHQQGEFGTLSPQARAADL